MWLHIPFYLPVSSTQYCYRRASDERSGRECLRYEWKQFCKWGGGGAEGNEKIRLLLHRSFLALHEWWNGPEGKRKQQITGQKQQHGLWNCAISHQWTRQAKQGGREPPCHPWASRPPPPPELKKWDMRKENHGGMAQERVSMWKLCPMCVLKDMAQNWSNLHLEMLLIYLVGWFLIFHTGLCSYRASQIMSSTVNCSR